MKQTLFLVLLIVAATGKYNVMAQAPAEKQPTFLSALKEGQPVSLKEVSGRYEITTVEGVAAVQGHKVVEIGNDYIVVQDIAGVTESRIPVYSVKAIIRLKVPKKWAWRSNAIHFLSGNSFAVTLWRKRATDSAYFGNHQSTRQLVNQPRFCPSS